jgi:hypothetical protein
MPLLARAIYAEGSDTTDPSKAAPSFTYQWTALYIPTGQVITFGSSTSQNTTVNCTNAIWHDCLIFCVATWPATGASSESDPSLAPNDHFLNLNVPTLSGLTRPATGAREWTAALDVALEAIRTADEASAGLASAAIDASGDLILTLDDASTINAGLVKPPRQRFFTATVNEFVEEGGALKSHLDHSGKMGVLVAWHATTRTKITAYSVALLAAGDANPLVKYTFDLYKISAANFRLDLANIAGSGNQIIITPGANDAPMDDREVVDITVEQGEIFGVILLGGADGKILTVALECVEV